MRALPFLAMLCLASGCGRVAVQTPPGSSAPAPTPLLEGWVQELGSRDPETKRLAADRLRAEGERALPLLEKASIGSGPEVSRARFLAQRISRDLTDRERRGNEAFLASASGAAQLAVLPRGSWVVVALGHLVGSGATREEAVAKGAASGARHRFVWRLGEPVADRSIEVTALLPGDLGTAGRKALGAGNVRLRPPGMEQASDWLEARLEASGFEPWPDAAAALAEPEALRLGLARWAIPGTVEMRSRMGAGVLTKAWGARAEGLSADGTRSCETEVWVLPEPAQGLSGVKGRLPIPLEKHEENRP